MRRTLIEAAVHLADTLARENAALRALDLAAAAGMLDEKQHAAEAFLEAQARVASGLTAGPLPGPPSREVAERLTALAEENRRLLERAIAVQGRLLGTLARAAQPVASRYGARGGPAYDGRQRAVALSARA